jgi:hypothetical protein
MGRIRTIKPEFPQSESMGRVSRDARLLFVQLWTISDDAGRARGAPRMLAGLLFPYDEDAPGLIEAWLAELEREGCVRRYAAQGHHYLQIVNWQAHQRIDRPSASKIPAPDDAGAGASPREASRPIRDRDQDRDPERTEGPAPPAGKPPDLASLVFGVGLDWLMRQSGQAEKACRGLLGKWRRDFGDEALITALGAGQREGPLDAVAWLERALRQRARAAPAGRGAAATPGLPAADPWDRRVEEFRKDLDAGRTLPQTFWVRTMCHHWGPPPGEPACQAPRAVLARHGFVPSPERGEAARHEPGAPA